MTCTPSQLLRFLEASDWYDTDNLAVDTETSGLYVDDGARVSTVSMAWIVQDPDFWELSALGLTLEENTYSPEGDTAWIVSVAWPFDQGVAGTGKPEDNGQMSLWAEADNLDKDEWIALLQLIKQFGKRWGLTFHNAKFDLHMLLAGCRRWPGVGINFSKFVTWDTQNGNSLLFPLLRDPTDTYVTTSLKPTSVVLHGEDLADEQSKVKAYLKKKKLPAGRWDLMPWDIVGPYADLDSRLTIRLRLRQEWEIDYNGGGKWLGEPADVLRFLERRLRITILLFKMELRGLPYDEIDSRVAAKECLDRAAKLAAKLPYKPTENAAKDFYFTDKKTSKGVEGLDLVPYAYTGKGAPSMTAEILLRMVNDNMPFAKEYAEMKKAQGASSMWYTAYADAMGPDGRLRTVFRQNGTRSHRFSVERVNLQAIPQDFRLEGYEILDGIDTPRDLVGKGVKAYPGWRLWELDLAQAELRVAAMFANCNTMLDMINNGEDLHSYTTKALFDMDEDHPNFFKHRQIGKRGNFSLIFGSGWETFKAMISKEVGLILEDHIAEQLVRDWNKLYPEFGRAIYRHMDRVVKRQQRYGKGWIDLRNGERRWFERYEDAHKAFNQRVQPNLAQFGIDWMLESEDILQDSNFQKIADEEGVGGVGLLLTIHDSQVIMAPATPEGDAVVEACAQAGRDLWVRTFPEVPGDVDCKPFRKE